jgi:hypothetical protein
VTYREGLGAINIGVDRSAQIRAFQSLPPTVKPAPQVSTPVLKYPPQVLPTRTTPTATPVKPTTPVLKVGVPVEKKPTTLPVFKPSVTSAPKPAAQTATVSMAPAPSTAILERTSESVFGAFTKSPLPLIAVGLGALFLFMRKERR